MSIKKLWGRVTDWMHQFFSNVRNFFVDTGWKIRDFFDSNREYINSESNDTSFRPPQIDGLDFTASYSRLGRNSTENTSTSTSGFLDEVSSRLNVPAYIDMAFNSVEPIKIDGEPLTIQMQPQSILSAKTINGYSIEQVTESLKPDAIAVSGFFNPEVDGPLLQHLANTVRKTAETGYSHQIFGRLLQYFSTFVEKTDGVAIKNIGGTGVTLVIEHVPENKGLQDAPTLLNAGGMGMTANGYSITNKVTGKSIFFNSLTAEMLAAGFVEGESAGKYHIDVEKLYNDILTPAVVEFITGEQPVYPEWLQTESKNIEEISSDTTTERVKSNTNETSEQSSSGGVTVAPSSESLQPRPELDPNANHVTGGQEKKNSITDDDITNISRTPQLSFDPNDINTGQQKPDIGDIRVEGGLTEEEKQDLEMPRTEFPDTEEAGTENFVASKTTADEQLQISIRESIYLLLPSEVKEREMLISAIEDIMRGGNVYTYGGWQLQGEKFKAYALYQHLLPSEYRLSDTQYTALLTAQAENIRSGYTAQQLIHDIKTFSTWLIALVGSEGFKLLQRFMRFNPSPVVYNESDTSIFSDHLTI